jgi:hypothetical protein
MLRYQLMRLTWRTLLAILFHSYHFLYYLCLTGVPSNNYGLKGELNAD